jgi:hypothetical protein
MVSSGRVDDGTSGAVRSPELIEKSLDYEREFREGSPVSDQPPESIQQAISEAAGIPGTASAAVTDDRDWDQ